MPSGSSKPSAASKGSKDGTVLHRSKLRLTRTTSHTTARSLMRPSSINVEQDRQSASHRASDLPETVATYDLSDPGTVLIECGAIFSSEYAKHTLEQDLSGLTLPAPNGSLLNKDFATPMEVIDLIPRENIHTCPIHSALFADLQDAARNNPNRGQGMALRPMDRYIAEGLAERYALLKLGQGDRGEDWARYFACMCDRNDHNMQHSSECA